MTQLARVIRLHPVLYDMHKDLRLALSYQLMVHGSLSPVVVERALQAVERQTIECARAPEQAVLYTSVHLTLLNSVRSDQTCRHYYLD